MDKVPSNIPCLNSFLKEERPKVTAYLRKNFVVSDFDIDDIYQEASLALFSNIQEKKLTVLTSSLATYFLRICINQAKTFCAKKKRVVPIINESNLSHNGFLDERLEELFLLTTADEGEECRQRSESVVNQIIMSLPETCKNIFGGYWKSRVRLTPEGEVSLTPENDFVLTPEEPWPVGSFLFGPNWLICFCSRSFSGRCLP